MNHYIIILLLVFTVSCVHKNTETDAQADSSAEYEFVLASEVEWTYLNPVRKDKAPMAGTLFGDRNSTEPTGYLLRPKDGFQSPPHIHNVSYRGIVISGLLHNDDPDAANMWMGSGSFWTQPKGEIHITSAKGDNALAYIEIDSGPYLVMPAEENFDDGERPVNIHQENIVWVRSNEMSWIENNDKNQAVEVAFLWGERTEGHLNGTLIKLPTNFQGTLINKGNIMRAVVISGALEHTIPGDNSKRDLFQGSYFGTNGAAHHQLSTTQETIIYIRTNHQLKIR